MDQRAALEHLIEERGEDYASLSRLIGRNAAYIQQFIKRGTPKSLAEEDRRILARYFGVPEENLGGLPISAEGQEHVVVPCLSVGASAGPGAVPSDERARAHFIFSRLWLRQLGAADPKALSIIEVEGDSMSPTLANGDEILVNRDDAAGRLRDGIYVLRMDASLMVKRIALNPVTRSISIRSDNEAYPGWPDCDPASLDIVGRVIWIARRLT